MTPAAAATFDTRMGGLQRSFVGICIAFLLIGGLVSMPTSCDCGAGVPHGHSLFILAGHHHAADGDTFGTEDNTHNGHQHHTESSASVGPQLMGRIMHNADRVAIAIPQFDVMATTWQRVAYLSFTDIPGSGHVVAPDAPPPQQASHG